MNKKIFTFLMLGILAIGIGSAVIMSHFGIFSTSISVSSPIEIYNNSIGFDGGLLNDGEEHSITIYGINKLENSIPAKWNIKVNKDGGITTLEGLEAKFYDMSNIINMRNCLGQTGECLVYDLNGDGVINMTDILIARNQLTPINMIAGNEFTTNTIIQSGEFYVVFGITADYLLGPGLYTFDVTLVPQ